MCFDIRLRNKALKAQLHSNWIPIGLHFRYLDCLDSAFTYQQGGHWVGGAVSGALSHRRDLLLGEFACLQMGAQHGGE